MKLDLLLNLSLSYSSPRNSVFNFSMFSFVDEMNYKEYFLVRNKCGRKNLIPEQKEMDFFLLIKGTLTKETEKEIIKSLIELPFVLMTMSIPVGALPSKQNLVF